MSLYRIMNNLIVYKFEVTIVPILEKTLSLQNECLQHFHYNLV